MNAPELVANVTAAMLRLAAPLMLAAMAGALSYKVGLINIALEGFMLVGAFISVAVGFQSGAALWGVLAACIGCLVFALIFAALVIDLRANLIVTGLAVNFLALGVTGYLLQILFNTSGTLAPPDLRSLPRLQIPGLSDIPLLGVAFLNHPLLVYVSWLFIPITAIFLYRTRTGAHIRAVGENPEAARTSGISVRRMQYLALGLGGVLCALAGSHLAVGDLALFRENMTAGRGFIALAAVYFAAGRPSLSAVACLLFGLFEALQFRLQQTSNVPPQFFQMLPYIIVVAMLTLISIRKEWRKGW